MKKKGVGGGGGRGERGWGGGGHESMQEEWNGESKVTHCCFFSLSRTLCSVSPVYYNGKVFWS